MQVRSAIEAVFESQCPDGAPLHRPLWWLHIVILAGCVELRGEPGCEPYAEDMARQAIRDALLGFPDDELAAASWRLQRVFIPTMARVLACAPLEDLSAGLKSRMSAEDRIRWQVDPARLLMLGVTTAAIRKLGEIDPWDVEELDRETTVAQEELARLSDPRGEWIGPVWDPWLKSWEHVDHLQMCALSVLARSASADDLLQDDEIKAMIVSAADSAHEVVSRVGIPRLGLR